MEPLQEKTLALLIQLPPSMRIMPGLVGLKELDRGFRYAVEVRHPSWFQDLAYNFFANSLVTIGKKEGISYIIKY
jgi:uncharacterized protein YecE (DUF72 family)